MRTGCGRDVSIHVVGPRRPAALPTHRPHAKVEEFKVALLNSMSQSQMAAYLPPVAK